MALLCLYLTNLQGEVNITLFGQRRLKKKAIKEINFQVLQKEHKFT
jgi:hypothetical protein